MLFGTNKKNPQDDNLKGKKTPVICQLLVNTRKRKLVVVVLQNNTWKCIFALGSGLEVHFSDTVYPCGLEDLWYPGAHLKKKKESVASSSREVILLFSALIEAPCGVLCSVLGFPVHERQGYPRGSLVEGHKDD